MPNGAERGCEATPRPGEAGIREPWLFVGDGDQPPHQNTIGHRWRQTCKRAGVSGVTLHDLRHYYASGLIAAGCDVVAVQRAMGHAKAPTTLNTYMHLWPTAEDRTRNAAATMMREATGTPTLADSVRTDEGDQASDLQNAVFQTLKRNSTTSPSAIT